MYKCSQNQGWEQKAPLQGTLVHEHSLGRGVPHTISKAGMLRELSMHESSFSKSHSLRGMWTQVSTRSRWQWKKTMTVSQKPSTVREFSGAHTKGPLDAPGDEPTSSPLWFEQRNHVLFCCCCFFVSHYWRLHWENRFSIVFTHEKDLWMWLIISAHYPEVLKKD